MEKVVLLAPQNWDYMVEDQTIAGCLENTWTPGKCSPWQGCCPRQRRKGSTALLGSCFPGSWWGSWHPENLGLGRALHGWGASPLPEAVYALLSRVARHPQSPSQGPERDPVGTGASEAAAALEAERTAPPCLKELVIPHCLGRGGVVLQAFVPPEWLPGP